MLTAQELAAIPKCLVGSVDDAANFAEAVWLARIELDLIEEGQDAAEHYTPRQVKQIRKFVNDNRASLKSMSS